jgi:glyoxylase-like metal-dependent hydrolase (beta-lactamase superfamily II)
MSENTYLPSPQPITGQITGVDFYEKEVSSKSAEQTSLPNPSHRSPVSIASMLAISGTFNWKELPVGFDPENYVVPGFKVTQWFKDGDRIELGNRSLEVLHTPGHTPDSVCLLDREDKLLFTGDMFYTGGIYTYLNGGDIPTFIDSYLRMLDYYDEYERLMPSHNEPWVEKILLKDVFKAVVDIAEGRGKYREGTDRGVSIRKYEFGRFSVVTRAP